MIFQQKKIKNFRDDSFLDIENEREKILLETKRDKAGNKRIKELLEKTNDIDTKKNEMNEPSNKSIKVREILNTSNTGKSSAIIYDEKKNNNTDKKTNIESDKKIEVNNNNTSEGSIFNKNKVKRIHLGKKEINSKEKFEKETKNDNIKIIGNNDGQNEADNDPPSNVMNSNEQNQLFENDPNCLNVYDFKRKLISKETIKEYIRVNKFQELEDFIFPDCNYKTFKENFGYLLYQNILQKMCLFEKYFLS